MPLVVYSGEESFLLERAVCALRAEVVQPEMASLLHRRLENPSIQDAIEAIGAVSLALGGQMLVEINGFSLLTQASKDAATDALLKQLQETIDDCVDQKVILWVAPKMDGKLKLVKWLQNHPKATVQKFEPFKFWEGDKAALTVQQMAKGLSLTLPPAGAKAMVDLVGLDLRLLYQTLEKLALFTHGRAVSMADVMAICEHHDNVFTLIQRWVLQQNPAENWHELHLTLQRRHPVELFATWQSYFNQLFRVAWLDYTGLYPDQIATRTGQKPFTIKKQLDQYANVPLQRWIGLKHQLVELEWKTKTGQLDGTVALELLLSAAP